MCPICLDLNANINFQILTKGVWKKHYKVFHCNKCNLYFLNEKPTEIELKEFYQAGYYSNSWLKNIIKAKFRFSRSISQYIFIKNKCDHIGKEILEVGAGDGLLLSLFKKNHNLTGIEYNSKYKLKAQDKYSIKFIEEDFNKINGKFDLIIMSHVFEHFLDFNYTYTQAYKLLNKGGYFFIELPNSPKLGDISSNELEVYLNTEHINNFNTVNLLKSIPKNFELIAISRFSYNISKKNKQKMIDVSKTLLDSKIKKHTAFDSLIAFFLLLFRPEKFYKEIDINLNWQGWGDNIRLILKKK